MNRLLAFVIICISCASSMFAATTIGDLCYQLNSKQHTATVTYKGTSSRTNIYPDTVRIPDSVSYEGVTYRVTDIGAQAFRYAPTTRVIVIPSTVTTIGNWAINSCPMLDSVAFPESITQVRDGNFCYSTLIRNTLANSHVFAHLRHDYSGSFSVPEGVTQLAGHAFCGCKSVTAITIPSSVREVGQHVFNGCKMLKKVEVSPDNPVFDSRDSCNAIIVTATNTMLHGTAGTVIPSSVTSLAELCFSGSSALKNIYIPSSVTSIGKAAFFDCGSLSAMTVDPANPVFDSRENCNAIIVTASDSLIAACSTSFIPEDIVSIGTNAFYTVPIRSIYIPASVRSISHTAFMRCHYLKSIEVDSLNPKFDSRENCNAIIMTANDSLIVGCRAMTVPDGVRSLGTYACAESSYLYFLRLPSTLTDIAPTALTNCTKLDTIDCYMAEPIEVEASTFNSLPDAAVLVVNPGTADLWQSARYWSRFSIVERKQEDEQSEITTEMDMTVEDFADTQCYDLLGRPVDAHHRGLVIRRGKVLWNN